MLILIELVSDVEVNFGVIFVILHNVFLSFVVIFQMVDFLFVIEILGTFINSHHPDRE